MHPILFEVFGFPISTFGVMMAVGFVVAAWVTGIRLREYGLDADVSSIVLMYALVGGVLGSKLYFAVDEFLRTGLPLTESLFSRSGITWYGGLIGGTIAVALGCELHRAPNRYVAERLAIPVPTRIMSSCVAVPAALGQACGRIGCFLVGDDYGRVTDLPWGVAFPEGSPPTLLPVHPTQLYEVAWLLLVAGLLWRRRKTSPFLFGEYVALAGFGRFFVEWLRVNPEVALGLTEPQWIGLALVVLGAVGWMYYRDKPEPAPA